MFVRLEGLATLDFFLFDLEASGVRVVSMNATSDVTACFFVAIDFASGTFGHLSVGVANIDGVGVHVVDSVMKSGKREKGKKTKKVRRREGKLPDGQEGAGGGPC